MVKKDGEHKETTWIEAVSKAAEGLGMRQASEVAVIASGRMSNEELFLAKKIADALGTDLLSIVPRQGESDGKLVSADRNANTTGASLIFDTEDPAAKIDAIREGVRSGKIKALVTFQENLLKEAGFKVEDLEKLDHLVSSHILANPTAANSDVVLPGAGFAEKRGTYVNVTGRLQRSNQAILTQGNSRDDWETLAALLGTLEKDYQAPASIDGVLKALASEVEAFNGQSFGSIGDQGVIISETGVTIPLIEQEKARVASGQING